MFHKKIKVNEQYSISRTESQWICTFNAIESENEKDQQGEVVKTHSCLLSMHEALTNEGFCGNELMNAVSHLLDMKQ